METVPQLIKLTGELEVSEKGLFFIIGCGRSGTTLLQVMLDSHPEIVMPNETHFFSSFSKGIRNRHPLIKTPADVQAAVDDMLAFEHIRPMNLDRARVLELAAEGAPGWDTIFLAILTAFREQRGGHRVGEKTPAHYLSFWHLYEAFPDAKFICLIRDPRAVVLSFMRASFYRNFGKNPMHAIQSWRLAVDHHAAAEARADPARYVSVRYEDLVHQPEEELRRLSAFLGIEFDPSMLAFHAREFSGFLAGESHKLGTLKPVYKDSTGKWREELSPSQVQLIESVLSSRMQRLGYALETSPRATDGIRSAMLYAAYKGRNWARKAMQRAGLAKRSDLGGLAETTPDNG